MVNVILGKEHKVSLAYALGLELRHPIMNMIGGKGARLERYRDT